MTRLQLKWLTFGLASAAVVISVAGFAAVRVATGFVPATPPEAPPDSETAEEPILINAPEAWNAYAEEMRGYNRRIAPLEKLYDRSDPPHAILKAFQEGAAFVDIETALERELSQITDPWEAEEYSGIISSLSSLSYKFEPAAQLSYTKRWTDTRPDSHFAWLVRGLQAMDYAWYWRGGGYANTVTQEGWFHFEQSLRDARSFLDRSYELNPNDPETQVGFMGLCVGQSRERAEVDRHFRQALAIVPTHLGAHRAMRWYLAPWWFGSWEQIDALERECERRATEMNSPLLGMEKYSAYLEMTERRDNFGDLLEHPDVQQEIEAIHKAVLDRWPDSDRARSNYAYVLLLLKRDAEALNQFEALGNRFPMLTHWDSLPEYHEARLNVYERAGRVPPGPSN